MLTVENSDLRRQLWAISAVPDMARYDPKGRIYLTSVPASTLTTALDSWISYRNLLNYTRNEGYAWESVLLTVEGYESSVFMLPTYRAKSHIMHLNLTKYYQKTVSDKILYFTTLLANYKIMNTEIHDLSR